MFFWKSKKALELESRVIHLEKQNIALTMTLQNLQAALIAMSKSQENISKDVRDIHAVVTAFLSQIDAATAWHNFDPDDGYEH